MRHYELANGAGIFSDTFKRLRRRGVVPGILYPAVIVPTEEGLTAAASAWRDELPPALVAFLGRQRSFLSINRFERKKVSGFASCVVVPSLPCSAIRFGCSNLQPAGVAQNDLAAATSSQHWLRNILLETWLGTCPFQ